MLRIKGMECFLFNCNCQGVSKPFVTLSTPMSIEKPQSLLQLYNRKNTQDLIQTVCLDSTLYIFTLYTKENSHSLEKNPQNSCFIKMSKYFIFLCI